MLRAAGAIFVAKDTGRILLNFRSDTVPKPATFGFWGGKINHDENISTGLTREIFEELGFIPSFIKSVPLDVYSSPDGNFTYYSFAVVVEEEFIPLLNSESDGYLWCNIGKYPRLLHNGARVILCNKWVTKELKKLCEEV